MFPFSLQDKEASEPCRPPASGMGDPSPGPWGEVGHPSSRLLGCTGVEVRSQGPGDTFPRERTGPASRTEMSSNEEQTPPHSPGQSRAWHRQEGAAGHGPLETQLLPPRFLFNGRNEMVAPTADTRRHAALGKGEASAGTTGSPITAGPLEGAGGHLAEM